jgi:hypothetical protein
MRILLERVRTQLRATVGIIIYLYPSQFISPYIKEIAVTLEKIIAYQWK